MAHYLISYDLRKQRNYQPLYKQLSDWHAQKLLESLWLAELRGPAEAIVNILKTLTDQDDGLAVIEIKPGSDWANIRALAPGTQWLRQHIHP